MNQVVAHVPMMALFVVTLALTMAAVEGGRWLGAVRKAGGIESDGALGSAVSGTLGLLAFVLVFTFGMAGQRMDMRKQMVVQDANAIGTTYLRTQLLAEPAGAQLRTLLREYVDSRVNLTWDDEQYHLAIARAEQLQGEMWTRAVALAKEQPTLTTTPLFIQALNDMIDVHGLRLAAFRNSIPDSIWWFLCLTTAISMLAIGYQTGLSGSRRSIAVFCLELTFACVILLITDLDRPQQGLLRVSQESMLDLQRSMHADAAREVNAPP